MFKFIFIFCCAVLLGHAEKFYPQTLLDLPIFHNEFGNYSRPEDIESRNDLLVTAPAGQLQGATASCGLFCSYFAWRGIPYAQAPIGQLRFRAPVPHPGWSGVLDATSHRSTCPSSSWLWHEYSGNEDCLFLNVYTQSIIGTRPVMVWIHGGSFTSGSGDSLIYGPDHLVTEDVVIVTINYRLGALGFLSTGDQYAPGNYGLKDMQEALRWIQRNILTFGGNPQDITIFGESAGGSAVHYLMLSPQSQGLFQKAISQSGSATLPWAFQPDPAAIARAFATRLGLTYTNNENLVAQLRNVPPNLLVGATGGWTDMVEPRAFQAMDFVPCVDAHDSLEPRFLTAPPATLLANGQFFDIPYLTGFNDAESIFTSLEEQLFPGFFDTYNANPNNIVPLQWNIPSTSPAAYAVSNSFRSFYWQNQPLSTAVMSQWIDFMTDQLFAHGIDQVARIHAERANSPVYYYMFSFDGDLNLVKRALQLALGMESFPGAMHADDIPYLFSVSSIPTIVLPTNHALTVRRRMCRLWTNFAKFANPTAVFDNLVSVNWQPINGNQAFLNIGAQLVPGNYPLTARLNLWNQLKSAYGNV